MNPCILDSDILSEILKRKDRRVIQRAEVYFQHFGFFTFSIVSWYEIVRGLRAIGAITRLQALDEFAARSRVLPVTPRVFDIAADIWVAGLGRRNRSYDADLLIAATAIEQAATLVTGNVNHFTWMPGVLIEDWRRSP